LEKNAAERFYSARDLAFALESLLRNTLSSGQTFAMPALTAESEVSEPLSAPATCYVNA